MDETPDDYSPNGQSGHLGQSTQIYEGTNQIQRAVIAKHLLK